jgi:hypothetical protein
MTFSLASHVSVDVLGSLLSVTGDIESVSGSLRDGKTVVEGNAAWDGTEATISI